MNSEYAHQAAHRDRDEHADRTLDIAVRQAADVVRDGQRRGDPHARLEARRILAKAERSASRVIG